VQKVQSKLSLLCESFYPQHMMYSYILFVDSQNNNNGNNNNLNTQEIISEVKYSSSKYKNYCNKKKIIISEITENENTNVQVNNDKKIDLYNDE
jgi:hypothetical protein